MATRESPARRPADERSRGMRSSPSRSGDAPAGRGRPPGADRTPRSCSHADPERAARQRRCRPLAGVRSSFECETAVRCRRGGGCPLIIGVMPPLTAPVVKPGTMSRTAQPVLTVGQLRVRPWGPSDVHTLVAAYSHPDIQQWHARSMTISEALEWIESRAERWEQECGADWAITEEADVRADRSETARTG